jgi:hypothetical protein
MQLLIHQNVFLGIKIKQSLQILICVIFFKVERNEELTCFFSEKELNLFLS